MYGINGHDEDIYVTRQLIYYTIKISNLAFGPLIFLKHNSTGLDNQLMTYHLSHKSTETLEFDSSDRLLTSAMLNNP